MTNGSEHIRPKPQIPTTEQVREVYHLGLYEVNDMVGNVNFDGALGQFDTWLAERDKAVAAEAWERGTRREADTEGVIRNPYREHQQWPDVPPNPTPPIIPGVMNCGNQETRS